MKFIVSKQRVMGTACFVVSVWLVGNQSPHPILHLLTAVELYLNAEMRANHSKIHHIAKTTKCYSYPLLFRNLLLDDGNKKLEEKSSKSDIEKITEAIKADALATCNLKKYSSMIHLVALTNWQLFNCVCLPRSCHFSCPL